MRRLYYALRSIAYAVFDGSMAGAAVNFELTEELF